MWLVYTLVVAIEPCVGLLHWRPTKCVLCQDQAVMVTAAEIKNVNLVPEERWKHLNALLYMRVHAVSKLARALFRR